MLYCTQAEIDALKQKLVKEGRWPKERRRQADIISLLSKHCHSEILKACYQKEQKKNCRPRD